MKPIRDTNSEPGLPVVTVLLLRARKIGLGHFVPRATCRAPVRIWLAVIDFQNRVLKCDVIKMKFLKLWDLSGYSERTVSKRPTCYK